MADQKIPHISVCIPTYKRPELLQRCLKSLENQETRGFSYSVVVVDNDVRESARAIADEWKLAPLTVGYDVEPQQNISLTRNRAINNSGGDLIAFIDDDEFPETTWLLNLFDAYERFSADGILGPVIPYYTGTPPGWLVRSGLCDRTSFQTGTVLSHSRDMRTGNVLLGRHVFSTDDIPFEPRLGRTGGEDADLFDRLLRRGMSFVWCQEAPVYEVVPKERQSRTYLVRRALIRGVTTADQEPFISRGTIKSVVAVVLYTLSLPFLLATAHHLFMKYLIKDCDHIAKLLAHLGIRLVDERTF